MFAYIARQSAGTGTGTPSGWPYGWIYPGDQNNTPYPNEPLDGGELPGIGWPDNWPVPQVANTTIVTDSPTQLSVSGNGEGTVTVTLAVGGDEAAASVYANHLLQITATHNGNPVTVTGPNGGGDAATVKVTEYAAGKWGATGTFDFNLAGLNIATDLIVEAELVTATLPVSDTDNTDLIS